MEWEQLIGPAVVAALVSGAISVISKVQETVARGRIDERLARLKAELDGNLTSAKAEFDRGLAEQKARLDQRAMFAAERVAHELLMHPSWSQRSFETIKGKLGGFEDDKLRQILVQAGAVCFWAKNGKELWGLLERNREALE